MLMNAIDDSGDTVKSGPNSSLAVVTSKIDANYVLLNNVDENLTLVQNNLQTSVDSIKNVDLLKYPGSAVTLSEPSAFTPVT